MSTLHSQEKDTSSAEEEAVPRRSLYNKQATGWKATAGLSITSLGIIYGDIGTSPLYVFNAIFPASGPAPPAEDVIGALSAIIWSITIVAFIKYCVIALEFGNDAGEGGPFAIYTAIYPPPEETDENRALTTYTTTGVVKPSDQFFERRWVKSVLFTWVLFGVCLIISDGLLTPAVSVVSAVGGIVIAQPSIENSVIPIAIAILVVLFTLQALGTRRVGGIFAPVIAIWLALNAGSGIYNIISFPGIFRAFDPSRAVLLFVRTGNYDLLSGVLLSVTGVEAMVANLGQFSKISIRLGFMTYVYPCLLLCYLGQGARLVDNAPAVLSNVFFQTIPGPVSGPFWWITWTFALLSSVIASQAMISATFSLVQQLTRLKAMPPVKIIHSSDKIEGQVFVPLVNFLCMLGTIGLIAGFGTGAGLTNAYGLAVSAVMIVSTTFIAIAIVRLKGMHVAVAILFFVPFVFVDALFFGSATKKIPLGAWFPLALATILGMFFLFWSWAKALEHKFDAEHRLRLDEVIARPTTPADETEGKKLQGLSVPISHDLSHLSVAGSFSSELELVKGSIKTKLPRIPVFAFFHNASANTMNGAPHSFSAFLKCYPSLPQVVVFFNIRVVGVPYTTDEERYIVSRVRSFDGVYIATLRLGYRDPIDLREIAGPIKDRIIGIERTGETEGLEERVRVIESCQLRAVTHILPELHVSVAPGGGNKIFTWVRTFLIQSIYRRLAVNFVETDSFVFNEEDVLRMSVHAPL